MIIKVMSLQLGNKEGFRGSMKKWTIIDGVERVTFNESCYVVTSLSAFEEILKNADEKFVYKNYKTTNPENPYYFSKIRYLKKGNWYTIITDMLSFICNDKGETVDKVPQKHPTSYYSADTLKDFSKGRHLLDQSSFVFNSKTKTFGATCIVCGKFFIGTGTTRVDSISNDVYICYKKDDFIKHQAFKHSKIINYNEELYRQNKLCLRIMYDNCSCSC